MRPQDKSKLLRVCKVTAATASKVERAFRPSLAEFNGMLTHLVAGRGISRNVLCASTGIIDYALDQYERGLKPVPGPIMRLIWLIYTMDTAPERAFNLTAWATWGKEDGNITTARRKGTPEEVLAALGIIRSYGDRRVPLYKIRKDITTEQWTPSSRITRSLCEKAGYKPPNANLKSYRPKLVRVPKAFNAGGVWMNTDWRKTNAEIAAETGRDRRYVCVIRRMFHYYKPRQNLLDHIKACGFGMERWEPVFVEEAVWKKLNNGRVDFKRIIRSLFKKPRAKRIKPEPPPPEPTPEEIAERERIAKLKAALEAIQALL